MDHHDHSAHMMDHGGMDHGGHGGHDMGPMCNMNVRQPSFLAMFLPSQPIISA
jgi:hypothetical protein